MNININIRTRDIGDELSKSEKIGNIWYIDISDKLNRIKTLDNIQKQLVSILYMGKVETCPECGERLDDCECNEDKTIPTPNKENNWSCYLKGPISLLPETYLPKDLTSGVYKNNHNGQYNYL